VIRSGRLHLDREKQLVVLAVLLALAIRLVYIVATRHHRLAGDEVEYDIEAQLAAKGHFLWSTTPYGIAHASAWKAPGYAAFLGVIYSALGAHPDRALVLQTLLFAPLAVLATWQLGRRLFGATVGVLSAFVVAIYPNAWQFDVRLYSEAISNPLTTATLAVALPLAVGGAIRPGRARLLALGAMLGAGMLLRPSALVVVPILAVACWQSLGARRGTGALVAILAVAAVCIAPWSIRNATLRGPWVPVSVQSAAAYGVFNDDAADDPHDRWAWRAVPSRDAQLFARTSPRTDGELYQELNRRTANYIREHPGSVLRAFWANGVIRLYDLRPPGKALNEVPFEGRTRSVTAIGLALYYPIALLALVALWQQWRRGRRALVVAVVGMGLASAILFTTDAGTRYRAPMEPLLVVLAMSALPLQRLRGWLPR
jgi:hypothetical protein